EEEARRRAEEEARRKAREAEEAKERARLVSLPDESEELAAMALPSLPEEPIPPPELEPLVEFKAVPDTYFYGEDIPEAAPAGADSCEPLVSFSPPEELTGLLAGIGTGESEAPSKEAYLKKHEDVMAYYRKAREAYDAVLRMREKILRAQEIRRRRAEEEARRKAEEEARRKAEEEARRKAEEEARRRAEEEARRRAEEEARRKAEEEARRRAEEEARRKAEEEARRRAEEEVRRKTEEEARRKAEEEARRKAEEERRRVEEAAAERKVAVASAPSALDEAASMVILTPAPPVPMRAVPLSEAEFKALVQGMDVDPIGEWDWHYVAPGPIPVETLED
ncbi:MAG: hypothetical protein N3A38_17090, partial [Planctomycetota bacterium]|nr:hypothetical protein [Planctomycetota bacterium]